ncbi:2,3-bisphosphoglycerate-independent phosphoglycerate mutase [Clostridiaceae bacterium HFYG-1003]|nr:2,3-bisphosphoglycerate-independent phosphoglycerate mutase [Clostridiaceae bacterium HFYG-1003]
MKKPVMLLILDGFGLNDKTLGNAVSAASKPNFDYYWNHYPHTTLNASGLAVGLPEGQMGNSEVGHMNIGAGRVVYQELTRISEMIKTQEFFRNQALNHAFDQALARDGAVHLLGLVSDGGVHSHIDHIKALIRLGKEKGIKKLYLHAFMDGRDTSPTAGASYLKELQDLMDLEQTGQIASVSGRYYAMDRDNRWERVERAYTAMVRGTVNQTQDAIAYLEASYEKDITDEFIDPVTVTAGGEPVGLITKGDSVIFFNFRPDRGREMTRALNDREFSGFTRDNLDLTYVTLTQYDRTLENVEVAYLPQELTHMLGELVSAAGKKQLRIAETEKYAHVTFFFNGGVEQPMDGEDRILIPSPKVATYDLKPEMSAPEVTDAVIRAMAETAYDMIVLNYANCDMVGHTGVFEAARTAVEYLDGAMKRVIDNVLEQGGSVFVTADHGNAEQLIDYETGEVFTSHTINPVPLIYITNEPARELRNDGILSDLAPTMLEEMDMVVPSEMTSKSLFKRKI